MPKRRGSREASALGPDSSLPKCQMLLRLLAYGTQAGRGSAEVPRGLGCQEHFQSPQPTSSAERMDTAQLPSCWLPACFQE